MHSLPEVWSHHHAQRLIAEPVAASVHTLQSGLEYAATQYPGIKHEEDRWAQQDDVN